MKVYFSTAHIHHIKSIKEPKILMITFAPDALRILHRVQLFVAPATIIWILENSLSGAVEVLSHLHQYWGSLGGTSVS